MTTNIGGGRALRVCDLCGGIDDHPRHSLLGGDLGVFPKPEPAIVLRVTQTAPADQVERLLTELLDTGTTDRHLDCCREAGCPTGDCNRRTAGGEDLRGTDLLDHLIGASQ
ncbi:hypothetical protein [Actinoplanes palleronii]|uniref:Uncharacterized protein n=1 Tax=Actinoplanes palleronii TaxID=113570 RepID=A0ABQ4B414_9ACTN|nr:hypothetical protein [Actinoplanes palleronii]GIE65400.1 hypothetical protein Apa02nite_015080 [Actinoplanes palleronii]